MRLRLAIPVAVSLIIVGLICCVRTHRTESVECAEATLQAPYLRAVVLLGNKKVLEGVISAGGGELVEREWDEFAFDFAGKPRLSKWEIQAHGRFKVSSSTDEFKGEMTLVQTVAADREGFAAHSEMAKPEGFVKACETLVSVTGSKTTTLKVSSRIVYERLVPFWMAGDVDSRVSSYNKRRAGAMLEVMKSAVEGASQQTQRTSISFPLRLP